MPWVQHDGSGNIIGLFANQQLAFTNVFLADSDPTVVAYLAAASAPTPEEQFANQLSLGIDLIWTISTDLNGVYSVDPQTQFNITAETVTILAGGSFSTGGSSRFWLNQAGQPKTMTIAQFKAFGKAVSIYVNTLYGILAQLQGGMSPLWPGNNVTINL